MCGHTLAGGLTGPEAWKTSLLSVTGGRLRPRSRRLPIRRRTAAVTFDFVQPTSGPAKIVPKGSKGCSHSGQPGHRCCFQSAATWDRTRPPRDLPPRRDSAADYCYTDDLAGLAATSALTSPDVAIRHPKRSRPAAPERQSRCSRATARPQLAVHDPPARPRPGWTTATPTVGRRGGEVQPPQTTPMGARARRTGHDHWSRTLTVFRALRRRAPVLLQYQYTSRE